MFNNRMNMALFMMEYVQALILFALLAFALYVEKSTREKLEEMPEKTEAVTVKIERMTEVLDDIANPLNEGIHALAGGSGTHTPSSPIEGLLNAFIGNLTAPKNHGPQENQRSVYEIDPTPNESQTENELD